MVGLEPVAPASEDGTGGVAVRVLLISANTERINMPVPPLGLGLVATTTRQAGHEVSFLDLLSEMEPDVAVQRAIGMLAEKPEHLLLDYIELAGSSIPQHSLLYYNYT